MLEDQFLRHKGELYLVFHMDGILSEMFEATIPSLEAPGGAFDFRFAVLGQSVSFTLFSLFLPSLSLPSLCLPFPTAHAPPSP